MAGVVPFFIWQIKLQQDQLKLQQDQLKNQQSQIEELDSTLAEFFQSVGLDEKNQDQAKTQNQTAAGGLSLKVASLQLDHARNCHTRPWECNHHMMNRIQRRKAKALTRHTKDRVMCSICKIRPAVTGNRLTDVLDESVSRPMHKPQDSKALPLRLCQECVGKPLNLVALSGSKLTRFWSGLSPTHL